MMTNSVAQKLNYTLSLQYPSKVLPTATLLDNLLWSMLEKSSGQAHPQGGGGEWDGVCAGRAGAGAAGPVLPALAGQAASQGAGDGTALTSRDNPLCLHWIPRDVPPLPVRRGRAAETADASCRRHTGGGGGGGHC